MKKTLLGLTTISLLSLIIVIGLFKQIQVSGKHSAKEWAIIAVEEEHYKLDDDGYLLTHSLVLQPPSLEILEEGRNENINGFLYGRDNEGYFYQAIFEHTLFVQKYDGKINKYVYLSGVAWRYNKRLFDIKPDPDKIVFNYSQIIHLDTEDVEWQ